MSFPDRTLHTTLDKFFGPYLEKTLKRIAAPIADKLILSFRQELLDKIEKELNSMDLKGIETDKKLKIIIEDKRSS